MCLCAGYRLSLHLTTLIMSKICSPKRDYSHCDSIVTMNSFGHDNCLVNYDIGTALDKRKFPIYSISENKLQTDINAPLLATAEEVKRVRGGMCVLWHAYHLLRPFQSPLTL